MSASHYYGNPTTGLGKTVIPELSISVQSWLLGRIDPEYLPVSETDLASLDLNPDPNADERS